MIKVNIKEVNSNIEKIITYRTRKEKWKIYFKR